MYRAPSRSRFVLTPVVVVFVVVVVVVFVVVVVVVVVVGSVTLAFCFHSAHSGVRMPRERDNGKKFV